MIYKRLQIPDIVLCKPEIHNDDRGYFVETFKEETLFAFLNKKINFCQDNESQSSYGVLRGLHFQTPPYEQSKLVRVIKGSVLDVIVDVRKNSKYFGKHIPNIVKHSGSK